MCLFIKSVEILIKEFSIKQRKTKNVFQTKFLLLKISLAESC